MIEKKIKMINSVSLVFFIVILVLSGLLLIAGCVKESIDDSSVYILYSHHSSGFPYFGSEINLTIFSNGTVKYYEHLHELGGKYPREGGIIQKEGRISEDELLTLVEIINDNNFLSMKTVNKCGF